MWQRSFRNDYETETFQRQLRKLDNLVTRGGDWARAWAEKEGPEHACLNQDRKSCLKLLYDFYDTFSTKSEQDIQKACKELGARRVHNILRVCLPMDRANCLYHMRVGDGEPGMHWISKKDLESERYRWVKNGYRGFGSINKRYSWIIEKFKLEDNEDFKKWLTPIVIRRLVAPYPDNPGNIGNITDFDNKKFDNEKFGLLK